MELDYFSAFAKKDPYSRTGRTIVHRIHLPPPPGPSTSPPLAAMNTHTNLPADQPCDYGGFTAVGKRSTSRVYLLCACCIHAKPR